MGLGNILIVPEFIWFCFERFSGISRHNPVRQTVPCRNKELRNQD